uniref:Nuclear transition protein 2 n=1 Tax=Castor canadensis TaxID=51338 RepID=A0A8B7UTI7_CASCN|nr:nuclear transition protein 2 [Castor canadensis]
MDTKMQSLPTTHTQPHSSSRPQSHTCSQCTCSLHCQGCSWGRSCSSPGRPSSSVSPSPPPKPPRQTTHSQLSPPRPAHYSSCPKNKKTLEGKVNKKRAVRRNKRVYRSKRQSTGCDEQRIQTKQIPSFRRALLTSRRSDQYDLNEALVHNGRRRDKAGAEPLESLTVEVAVPET